MIDPDVFAREMGVLEDRFPGERSDEVLQRYYRVLNRQMETGEFVEACERLFVEREHFPRPVDFLEATGRDPEAEALEQWELVREAMTRSRDGLPDEATDETRRLVAKEGGLRRMGQMKLDEVQFVEKRFKADYGTLAASRDQREPLPPMSEDGKEALQAVGAEVKTLE